VVEQELKLYRRRSLEVRSLEEQPWLVPLAVVGLQAAVDCVREQVQPVFLAYAHPPVALPALGAYVHPLAALLAYVLPAVAYAQEACALPVCAPASERDVPAAARRDDARNGGDNGGGQVRDDDVLEHGACCVPEYGGLDDDARACGVLDDGVPAYGRLPAQAYGVLVVRA
jgi:hypothetical protein